MRSSSSKPTGLAIRTSTLEDDRLFLQNVVRQAVAALTAVEIDTEQGARDHIKALVGELGDRPHAVLDMQCDGEDAALRLLRAARETTADWPAEEGVLFLLDLPVEAETRKTTERQVALTGGAKTNRATEGKVAFWRAMNLQREGWGALDCHAIFFLLTGRHGNYNLLLTVADHLADWMPLKLYLLGESSTAAGMSQAQMPMIGGGDLSPNVALERLEVLEGQLITEPAQPDRRALVRRYYLPMLEAALSLNDLNRAQALRARVEDEDDVPISESDLPKWWSIAFGLDLALRNLDAAERAAKNILNRASAKKDIGQEGIAFHYLGIVAQERRDFDAAEKWYLKSLAIDEKQGNEHGAAISYHQMGMVAHARRDFDAAEKWYLKSLAIKEKQGNEHGATSSYGQLGNLARLRDDLEISASWLIRCAGAFAGTNDREGVFGLEHRFGPGAGVMSR